MAKLREFEYVMNQVPMMEYEMGQGFPMIALAQHYGMCTDYVDFSGSFAVALFFATCIMDRKTNRYRPMNHREISKSPTGSIYMTLMSMVPLDDLEIIGFSSVNRPSLQHGFLIHDHGGGNMEPYTHKMTFRQSIRLSNEMFRFFDKGKALFPEVDSDSVSHLANVIMDSKTIYKGFFIESCREMGLEYTDAQFTFHSEAYEFENDLPKVNPRDIAILDMDLGKSDFIFRSGMRFTSRLAFYFDV